MDPLTAAEAGRSAAAGNGQSLANRASDHDVEAQALRALGAEQLRHRIREIMAGLPDDERRVLRLRLFEGRSETEIALLLERTEPQVSGLWQAGFDALWSALRRDPSIWLEDDEDRTTE